MEDEVLGPNHQRVEHLWLHADDSSFLLEAAEWHDLRDLACRIKQDEVATAFDDMQRFARAVGVRLDIAVAQQAITISWTISLTSEWAQILARRFSLLRASCCKNVSSLGPTVMGLLVP